MLKIVTQFLSDSQIGFVPRTYIAEATQLVKLIQAHLDNNDEEAYMIFPRPRKSFRQSLMVLHERLC